jgi:hypothetical protein
VVDVIVSSDELSVVGGPATVNVEVDFGPAGQRGSQIFAGVGQPNNPSTVIGQDPRVLDLYINLAPATVDEEYLNVYQYQNIDGSNTWVKLFDLIPQTLSVKKLVDFGSGSESATVYIPVADITPIVDGLTSSNFNVQYSIENSNPVSAGMTIGELVEQSGVVNLPITMNAVEFSSSTWSDLSGNKTVNLFITVV